MDYQEKALEKAIDITARAAEGERRNIICRLLTTPTDEELKKCYNYVSRQRQKGKRPEQAQDRNVSPRALPPSSSYAQKN